MSDEIRVLAVRQPWASLIVEGLKTIEVRSRPTNIRGKVAIYASTKKPTFNDLSYVHEKLGIDQRRCYDSVGVIKNDSRGTFEYIGKLAAIIHPFHSRQYHEKTVGNIIGTIEITDCNELSISDFREDYLKHLAPDCYWSNFAWSLSNPFKFSEQIPYKPPKGAAVWSKTVLPEGYI